MVSLVIPGRGISGVSWLFICYWRTGTLMIPGELDSTKMPKNWGRDQGSRRAGEVLPRGGRSKGEGACCAVSLSTVAQLPVEESTYGEVGE